MDLWRRMRPHAHERELLIVGRYRFICYDFFREHEPLSQNTKPTNTSRQLPATLVLNEAKKY